MFLWFFNFSSEKHIKFNCCLDLTSKESRSITSSLTLQFSLKYTKRLLKCPYAQYEELKSEYCRIAFVSHECTSTVTNNTDNWLCIVHVRTSALDKK